MFVKVLEDQLEEKFDICNELKESIDLDLDVKAKMEALSTDVRQLASVRQSALQESFLLVRIHLAFVFYKYSMTSQSTFGIN